MSDDDGGGGEIPGQVGGGSGGAGTGFVEEFVAVTAFDGGVLDVFGAVGAFFHGIQAFCLLLRLFEELLLGKIVF